MLISLFKEIVHVNAIWELEEFCDDPQLAGMVKSIQSF